MTNKFQTSCCSIKKRIKAATSPFLLLKDKEFFNSKEEQIDELS